MPTSLVAVPGLVLTFIAWLFLLLTSVSVPVSSRLSFLTIFQNGFRGLGTLRLGAWGYCSDEWAFGAVTTTGALVELVVPATCSSQALIYDLNGMDIPFFDGVVDRALTGALVLQPIACGLAFITLVIGTMGLFGRKVLPVVTMIVTVLTVLTAWTAWATAMALFAIARNRVRDNTNNVITAHFGSCIWLGLIAALLLTIAMALILAGMTSKKDKAERIEQDQEKAAYVRANSVSTPRSSMAAMVTRPPVVPVAVAPETQSSSNSNLETNHQAAPVILENSVTPQPYTNRYGNNY